MTLVSCHRKPIHRETLRQCWRVYFFQHVKLWRIERSGKQIIRCRETRRCLSLSVVGDQLNVRRARHLLCWAASGVLEGASRSAPVCWSLCVAPQTRRTGRHIGGRWKKNSLLREFQILIKHTPIDSYWGAVHFLFWLGLDATKRSATNLRKLTRATAVFIVSAGLCGWPLSRIGLDPKDLR